MNENGYDKWLGLHFIDLLYMLAEYFILTLAINPPPSDEKRQLVMIRCTKRRSTKVKEKYSLHNF